MGTPRTITVRGRGEYHRNYASLRERAEALHDVIVELDGRYPPGSIEYMRAAREIGELAADLREILDAMFAWLAENDRQILENIEAFRRDLRNLNETFAIGEDEEHGN
jgi:hypothetical protein